MAVIAGNLDLAEVIKNYKAEEVGESGPGSVLCTYCMAFNGASYYYLLFKNLIKSWILYIVSI